MKWLITLVCLWTTTVAVAEPITPDLLTGKQAPNMCARYPVHERACADLQAMITAAAADGLRIHVASGYRDFTRQREIWGRKYHQYTRQERLQPMEAIRKIIRYSAIPGTSRHHWGTDVDLSLLSVEVPGKDVLIPYYYEDRRYFGPLKEWLDANAAKYGFYEVYYKHPGRTGFGYEPWHWSYQPLSVEYLAAFSKLNLKQFLQQHDLPGSRQLTDEFIQQYFDEYVLGINSHLIP